MRFVGKPDELSPKAMLKYYLGLAPRPFDRHDWTVDRCGTEVRYIIDYYDVAEKRGADRLWVSLSMCTSHNLSMCYDAKIIPSAQPETQKSGKESWGCGYGCGYERGRGRGRAAAPRGRAYTALAPLATSRKGPKP